MRWLPNLLTLLRLALVPAIVFQLLGARYRPALALFFAAGLTDGIDGYLARRFQWTSRFGAYLDPIADKVLLSAIYVALAFPGAVPVWLVALILGRDVLILLFAIWALVFTRLRSFPPSVWGKLSTFSQISCAVYVMTASAFPSLPVGWLRPAALALAAAGTAWSGVDYLRRGWRMVRADRSRIISSDHFGS